MAKLESPPYSGKLLPLMFVPFSPKIKKQASKEKWKMSLSSALSALSRLRQNFSRVSLRAGEA
jgi:hypothetical protein